MKKILFVCLGNICRSPMAEKLMENRIKELKLENELYVESRATSSYEIGNPPHKGTVKVLDKLGISTKDMAAKQITANDILEFDYIIGMDNSNVKNLKRLSPNNINKIYLYLDLNENIINKDIPDPWYTGDFLETYQLIMSTLDKWIEKIVAEKKVL